MGMPCNYDNVKNNCKGEKNMRKYYLDTVIDVSVHMSKDLAHSG